MDEHNTLNYWLHRSSDFELLGFARIVEETGIGIVTQDNTHIVPLKLGNPGPGWGDGEPTSAKFPYVLLAEGNDDWSYYMLFGNKKAAIEFAEEHMQHDGSVIDPYNEQYHGRRWQSQN